MTAAEFIQQMENAVSLGEEALGVVAELDPAAELPIATVGLIAPIVEKLVEAAINGWSQASGTPITVESITLLLPNPTPLTPPSA